MEPKGVITEIGPDLYRLSIYAPDFDLQFNHFLIKDDEPLLYHAGLNGMFPTLREAVAKVLDPASLRWIGFSHFESDECGALNQWLEVAPSAQPVCSDLGAMVSVNDFSARPGWRTASGSPPASTAFVPVERPTSRTAGTRRSCSRRPARLCCAPTSFINWAMSSRSRHRMWSGVRRRR
ncbi:MAG: hypothetical protein R3344_02340 [Acidobacteriota bacterium]|nr:hypothetical protein [Acidobacteriota bacterium]